MEALGRWCSELLEALRTAHHGTRPRGAGWLADGAPHEWSRTTRPRPSAHPPARSPQQAVGAVTKGHFSFSRSKPLINRIELSERLQRTDPGFHSRNCKTAEVQKHHPHPPPHFALFQSLLPFGPPLGSKWKTN